jgi:hypothetical protein
MEEPQKAILDKKLKDRLTTDEFGALSRYCQGAECSIRIVKWLGGSESNAKLAEVIIDDNAGRRRSVLKYCPAKGTPTADYLAFKRAEKNGPPRFAATHLVRIDREHDRPIINGTNGLFILMESRSGGQFSFDTMTALLGRESLPDECEKIVSSILGEWNERDTTLKSTNREFTAGDFIREIVGDGCEPGGSIRLTAERLGVVASESTLPDRLLPNPIAAATRERSQGRAIDDILISGIRGNAHGDLHPDNILLPLPLTGESPSSELLDGFVLIDLTTYSNERLLSVDPVYLLLSIVARRLTEIPDKPKTRLHELILDPEGAAPGKIPGELIKVTQQLHYAGLRFAEERGLRTEWLAETTVATAGCALLFVGHDLPEADRRWFLELAALAIEKIETLPTGQRKDMSMPDAMESATPLILSPDLSENPTESSYESTGPLDRSLEDRTSWSREEEEPMESPGTQKPDLTPDEIQQNVTPLKPQAKRLQGTSVSSENISDAVLQNFAEKCAELAARLASEISEINDNLSAEAARDATMVSLDLLEELSATLTMVQQWQRQNKSEWNITLGTTIGALRTQLNSVTFLVRSLGENGTTPRALQDIGRAVRSIQRFIRKGMQFDTFGKSPGP